MYDDVQHFYYANTKSWMTLLWLCLPMTDYSWQIDPISCAEGGRFEW